MSCQLHTGAEPCDVKPLKGIRRAWRPARSWRSIAQASCFFFRRESFATSKVGVLVAPVALPSYKLLPATGSYLNHMFSDAYIQSVPRDDEAFRETSACVLNTLQHNSESRRQGRYFLDFNPTCFGIIVDWLRQLEALP